MTQRQPTAQETFWREEFGDEYQRRNDDETVVAGNTRLFAQVLSRTSGVRSVLELGANIGMNLRAIDRLLPNARLDAVEINHLAAERLRSWGRATVHEGSLVDVELDGEWDLTFAKGVLIHLHPDLLPTAYDRLHAASSRYVMVAEYYNPVPVSVEYRGHADRLWKRDFAGELMERHRDLELVDYGFVYRRDPAFPLDDVTWFLLRKR